MFMEEIKKFAAHFDALVRSLPNNISVHIDLDATLLDNEGPQRDLARDVVIRYMREEFEQPDFARALERKNYGHLSGTDEIRAAIEAELQVKVSDEGREEIKKRMASIRATHVPKPEEERPIVPIAALVYSLRQHNVPCCIVTSSGIEKAMLALEVSGLDLFPRDRMEEWFFTSNKGPKTPAHLAARDALSRIHGRELTHMIAVEDSPGAVLQAGLAGAIVIPHNLCTHVPSEHRADRIRALRTEKLQALHTTGRSEEFVAQDGKTRTIQTINDIMVVTRPDELVSVLERTIAPLGVSLPQPARPHRPAARTAPAAQSGPTGVR